MENFPVWTALYLGILTSISPCPLASNIAAVSYLAGGTGRVAGKNAALAGLLYTLGRMTAYTILAGIITYQFLSVPAVANFLQKYMSIALGPLLAVSGLIMLDLIDLRLPEITGNKFIKGILKKHTGPAGAGLMGIIFAFSFCPVSAALFFGSLLPLAVGNHSPLIMPLAYGAGTAAPVVGISLCIGFGIDVTGRFYDAGRRLGGLAKKATGTVFVLVGGYYIWTFLVPIFVPLLLRT